MEGHPELLVVSGLGVDHPDIRSLVSQFLEQGIYLEHDQGQALPARLPQDLGGYKAVMLDPVAAEAVAADSDELARLAAYARDQGYVFRLKAMGEGDDGYYADLYLDLLNHHQATYAIKHAGLTPFHPAMERIQLARSDERILAEVKALLIRDINGTRRWNEFTMHNWKAAIALIRAGHDDVKPPLMAAIRESCHHPPAGAYGDQVSGLFGAAWHLAETGETAPLEAAKGVMDRVLALRPRTMGCLNFGGITDDPLGMGNKDALGSDWGLASVAQRAVFWNEALHMQCAPLAALSRATGDRRYLEEALRMARHVARYHLDQDGLLFHASREGKPITGKWGRGHTHALYGLIYTLEEMAPDDPERRLITDLLYRVGRGLRGHQDPRTGLWRNEVATPQSRLESSCTAGIVYVYGRCIREGWLPRDEFAEMVARGWQGLKRVYWRGGVGAQCRGTAIGDASYYWARPHGWRMVPQVIMALLEAGPW